MSHEELLKEADRHVLAGCRDRCFLHVSPCATLRAFASALRAEVEAHAGTRREKKDYADACQIHLANIRDRVAERDAARADLEKSRAELADARGRIEAASLELRHHGDGCDSICDACRALAALSPPPPQPETKEVPKT